MGVEPASGAITLSDEGVIHLYREHKRDSGVGLPRSVIERAVDALWEPEAIYWDKNNPALLYLIDAGEEAGKMVVRVNHTAKIKVPTDGAVGREKITTNDLWSGRVIDAKIFENATEFERIK